MRSKFLRTLPAFGWVLLYSILLTLVLYREALWLPYFFDDLDHVPFAMQHRFAEIWQSPGGFPYFRPLGVSALRFVGLLFGTTAVAHHAFNLMLHALNGALVGMLAGRLDSAEKHPHTFLAATLFIIFPFSYQAVPWVDAVYHLIVTSLLLIAVNSYLQYRTSQWQRWAGMAVTSLFLAPFAHENGLIGGGLIVLLALFHYPTNRQPASPSLNTLWSFAWLLPGLVAFAITSAVPSNSRSELAFNGLETLWQNSTYYLQGLTFPISWIGGAVVRAGFSDLRTVWIIGFGAAILVVMLSTQLKPAHWLGLAWFAGGCALAIAFLNFQYVIDGARLLMVASVGIALFWSQVLIDGWEKRWARPIVALLILVTVAANGRFIRDTVNTHRVLGEGFWHVVEESTREDPATGQVAFVNVAEWAANRQLQFAVGHEGAMFLPRYIPAHRIVSGLYPTTREMQFINDPATLPMWAYHFDAINAFVGWDALRSESVEVFQIDYSAETATKRLLGTTNVLNLTPSQPTALFIKDDAQITLAATTISISEGSVLVALFWQASGSPAPHHKVFVHVLDEAGQLVAQADGLPLNGLYPWDQWPAGAMMHDHRYLPAVGATQVLVGIYDGLSGERWIATSAENQPFLDNAVPLP